MKAFEQIPSVPESGIVIRPEGDIVRLFFDIEPASPVDSMEDEETSHPDDLCQCYNVDVPVPISYGAIVAAIVNDKYSSDDVQALSANYIEAKEPDSLIDEEKREEYLTEYSIFQGWRRRAKEVSSAVLESLSE